MVKVLCNDTGQQLIPTMMKDLMRDEYPASPKHSLIKGDKRRIFAFLVTFALCVLFSQHLFASVSTAPLTPNQHPHAVTDIFTTDEDVPLTENVLTNDSDPEGSPLHVTAETKATDHGQVVIHADGTFTYTPDANFHGEDTFNYRVCDDETPTNACCNGTVKITVVCKQDPPLANPDAFSTNEDTQLVVNCFCVLDNDVDPDGEPLTAVLGQTTQHGTLVFNPNGTFTYMPNLNYNGIDTFTYYANDGKDNSAETLVTITVIPVNDPPVAANDAIVTNEDTAIDIPVLSNDSDVDNVLTGSMIKIVTQPAHGVLVVNTSTGKVRYTPAANYYGGDSFTYKLKDTGGAFSNVATVSITVNPVNDAPVAVPDQATTPEEVPVVISVLDNDTDVDNPISTATVTVASNPAHGSVSVQPDGRAIEYSPEKDYNGTDTFTYTVTDAGGATSAPGAVTIIVTPVNDAPVAMDDAATTNENTPVGIPVLDNDFDVDDVIDPSSLAIVTAPQHGTVSINPSTGIVTYTPQQNYVGNDSFSYTVEDPSGAVSAPATVTISVINVNLPPVAVDDAIVHSSILPVSIDVLDNDYDPDNSKEELTIVSVTTPTKGSARIAGREIVYTPEGTNSTTVTFTYKISDPDGLTDEAVVTIEYEFKELIVSQGFSPNGDGNNDFWYIQGIEGYPTNIVKVYDRWGLLVYQKSGYENSNSPWDGRGNVGQFNGKLVERGTYFYILEPGGGLSALNGYVVVIR